MSAVDDVQSRLQAQGLVDGGDWTSTRRRMHDNAEKVVVISEDGGPTPEFPASQGLGSAAEEDVGVQIMVRGEPWDGDQSEARAEAIREDLHGLKGVSLNGTAYRRVRAMTGEPVFAGFDDQGRPTHTVAFRLLRDGT